MLSLSERASQRFALALNYLAAMALFFRGQILSGFDRGFSDRADGMIEISILEHWRNVLSGAAAWNMRGYFHPYPGTLGYNDGYFLYGLVYSGWRVVADPFLADTLNIATFKTVGFFAAYMLVARMLRWGKWHGLLVAFLFTNANGLMVQAGHAQLQSIALLPVAMILAVAIVQAEQEGRRRAACGAAALLGLLMAAWLLTSYYMAWFTVLFGALFASCWLVSSGHWRPASLWRFIVRHNGVIETGAIAFFVAIVPFLTVYLPKVRETGGQPYRNALSYLVLPLDPINVGSANYVWGWVPRALPDLMPGGEHISGIAPLMFALAVVALWRIVASRGALGRSTRDPVLLAFALAIIVGGVLTVRIGDVSAWAFVYDLVPGAKGVRVVLRFQLFLVLPLLLVVVATYRAVALRWAGRRPLLLAAVLAFLLVEQFGSDVPVQISRSIDGAALRAVPPPPGRCRSFYVVAARRDEPIYVDAARTAVYPHNVDAMFLAERWRLPTINGLSTFNPPDWDFADPRAFDYDARVAAYSHRHVLTDVCRLDMMQRQPWTRAF